MLTISMALATLASVSAIPFAVRNNDGASVTVPGAGNWSIDGQSDYTLAYQFQDTCNNTAVRQIQRGLDDMYDYAGTARQYLLERGGQDDLFKKWFGDNDYTTVLGDLDSLLYGNKAGLSFRCDDPEGGCNDPAWYGYGRKKYGAPGETVICPRWLEQRLYKEQFCSRGWTVAGGNTHAFAGIDLLHRMYGVPPIADGEVLHATSRELDYQAALDLLQGENATLAAHNIDSIQYFVAEVYSYVAEPGQGCLGEYSPVDVYKPAPANCEQQNVEPADDDDD